MIGQTISHYKILEKLGEGGMGVVYKAEDTKLKRYVALKFLPPDLLRDEESKQRFIFEAQTASALDHQNICTIFEVGETDDGQIFIAMACYNGETLKQKISSNQLTINEVIDIAIQIAQGLKKAHEKGIIHRDIKPANIFITNDGTVKILDFGLAKLSGQINITKAGSTLGTVAYMSPEQARGEEVTVQTDIWSLGVVLYEMVTGQLPFKSEYEQAIIYSILNEEPKSVISQRSDAPQQLDRIIQKTLEKNKNIRYQNIQDLIIDLKQVIVPGNELPKQEKLKESIVVLPFKNMSADPEQEYFCEGIAEELINALTQIKDLWVVARTSAFSFKGKDIDIREIGKQLNVDKALEGSIRKSGQKLRITAQLINVKDGYHLWSERYDCELKDVFDIQDEISLAIVEKLKVTLLGEENTRFAKRYTDNFEVYDLYLRGRYFLNIFSEEGIKKSLDYFQQAIKKDPNYALAYSGEACVYFALAVVGQFPSNQTMPKAKSKLMKAIEMDDSLAEVHAWLGDLYLVYDWDWSSAEREIKRAIELKPNSPEAHQFYADYLSVMGRPEEALAEAERALTLDPLSIIAKTILIWQYFVSHQYDRVIEHCREVLKAEPNFLIQMHLWRALRRKNVLEEAWVECKKFFNLFISSEIAEAMECSYKESGYIGAMRTAAENLVEQSKRRYISPCIISTIFAHAEDDDQTLNWLEKAYEERDQYFYSIRMDPDWDRVHSNPRFNALLKKIGLEK